MHPRQALQETAGIQNIPEFTFPLCFQKLFTVAKLFATLTFNDMIPSVVPTQRCDLTQTAEPAPMCEEAGASGTYPRSMPKYVIIAYLGPILTPRPILCGDSGNHPSRDNSYSSNVRNSSFLQSGKNKVLLR